MNTMKTPKDTIKTILRGRLTLPEMALVEAYMNQEIAEFNKAATERNTLLAEVQDLTAKCADKARSVENYKDWLKKSYKINEVKRDEINALEETVKRLTTLRDDNAKGSKGVVVTVHIIGNMEKEIARKEAVIQTTLAKQRASRKVFKDLLRSSEAHVHALKQQVDGLQKDQAHDHKQLAALYNEVSTLYKRLGEKK